MTLEKKVQGRLEEKNSFIDMSMYNDGSTEFNIYQRRDIYHDINDSPCLLFFNYNTNDELRDIEIHNGIILRVKNIILSFDKEMDIVKKELSTISPTQKTLDGDSILFEQLKLVIASDESMGGNGNNLGYLFISNDISHLINNVSN